MKTYIKKSSQYNFSYIFILAVLVIFWQGGDFVIDKLSKLPIKSAPHARDSAPKLDQKDFYSVWVKQIARVPKAPDNDQGVDAIFRPTVEKVEPLKLAAPIPPPNYHEMFKNAVRITGVANDGIFINNQFYKVGQPLDPYAMTSTSGKPVIPILTEIKHGRVTFLIDKKPLQFNIDSK